MSGFAIILDSNTKNLPVVDFAVTRGDTDEVLGTVIFEVIVGFVDSVDTVATEEEILGTVGKVLVVELLVTLGCIVTKRKK